MKKIFISGLFGLVLSITLMAQQNNRPQVSPEDRAKMTVDKIASAVTLTANQKTDMIAIFKKFYEDVQAQQAFRDLAKREPLEKARDAKVEKLLNNKTSYKKYKDLMEQLKSQFKQHQEHPHQQ